MSASVLNWLRAAVLLAVLTGTARAAPPAPSAPQPTAARERDSAEGLLVIAGIVGVGVLLAWVCARVSDTRNTA